jgi:GT2 family glycosyltransferase
MKQTYNSCNYDFSKLEQPYFGFISNNASIHRKNIDVIGLLDNNFVYWGLEDTEFAYRCYKRGIEIFFAIDANAYHQWHEREMTDGLDVFKKFKIQNEIFYKKFLDNELLAEVGKYLFFDTNKRNLELISENELLKKLLSEYRNWVFSKEEFEQFVGIFYEYLYENKHQNNLTLKNAFTNHTSLLNLLNSGFFKSKMIK